MFQKLRYFVILKDCCKSFNIILNQFTDNNNVEIIKDFSIKTCKLFKDNSLDFVYIDRNHQYSYVYNDIKNWYNKIKIDGILCGHDIDKKDVCNALIAYCNENKITFYIDYPNWYIIKKKK